MNRAELLQHVTSTTDLDAADSAAALDAVVAGIESALSRGEQVTLPGFGIFSARESAARTGRNPQTGESLAIAASTRAVFKASAGLRRRLNDSTPIATD